ncbi:MAG TPA: hypothetical protein VGC42_29195 [Kofleriaceae bacterium]
MNHLNNIADRQRNSSVRDAIFAAFVALGVVVSATTISTAASVANTSHKPAVAFVASR